MVGNIKQLFRPAPYLDVTRSPEEVDRDYKYWRIRIFYSMYMGYVFFYFTRKSFTFAMPKLIDDLGFSNADLGFLGSALYISYGMSKFASGILSDRSNPRYFMSLGLILTGIANICFGMSSSLYMFAIFWTINGLFQGWGWPPCTKLMTYWFSKTERGFWWSFGSTSHNVGGALIPLFVALVSSWAGWRWSMYAPGIVSIVMGLFLLESLRDVPRSLGLPAVEEYRGEEEPAEEAKQESEGEKSLSVKQILFNEVLSNKSVWLLALSYFFVYVVRTAVNDWGTLYLHKAKGFSLIQAAASISWFELGGFFGCLAAGWCSDRWFQGRRVPFMVLCAIGLLGCINLFWTLPDHYLWLENTLMASIGFLIFGPQMLVGLAAAEFVDKKAACTANGFAGCFAYVGAAATGYPLGKIIDLWGWKGYFTTLSVCAALFLLILFPLWLSRRPHIKKATLKPTPSPQTIKA
ncbi:MAG: MFS transporter [Oligoflexales bacterium]|nr:MFS transporter [Oligoflexales bacterium]